MSYHPRIECQDVPSFQTTRARNSELWFVNNPDLEESILGYAARYSERHQVTLYALAIEGNHIHLVAQFSKSNRAHFMRDFNSAVARAIPRYQHNYPGGRFWARRYSAEYLPGNPDVEEYFFYTVLQPVNDGLVDDIAHYPDYNCFEDAITGKSRHFTVINWKDFNDAERWDPSISIEHYTEVHTLTYARLPGYEDLPQHEYESIMRRKLRERTAQAISARRARNALGVERMKQTVPGSVPPHTKRSRRNAHRPRVLSVCNERRASSRRWYFSMIFEYRRCSARYRAGKWDVEFPRGMYKPPLFTIGYVGSIG